ncbi:MAG: hypothetical protein E7068_00155 [Lentimicrobiaceae bacterium]|nr:hypothetical protein [Lentimicrobiaceae bacterium]
MRRWIKCIMALLIGTLLLSCRNGECGSEGSTVETSDQHHNIIFSMSLDHNVARDDGNTWNDNNLEELGNSFENRILPNALRVSIYTIDNIRLGEVRDLYYWPSNDEMTEFKFVGVMPEDFTSHFMSAVENGISLTYKIMVLANCPQGKEENLTYNYTCLDKENGAIPMWGIKTVDLSELANTQSKDVGTIWLLRSAAKLEVLLSDALKDKAVINNVYVNYYNQTGYCLPTGWNTVERTEDLNMTNCFRLFRHTAVKHAFKPDGDNTIFNAYVSEYDNTNINYSDEKAKISIDLTYNGQQRFIEDAISFCHYSNGSPVENSDYNIVRNHIYQYRIVKITGDNILLEYSVADWELEDWGNGMGYEEHDLSYPTYHNPVVPLSFFDFKPTDETPHHIITEEPVMYYNSANPKEGAFECYFQITAPEGVQWKPNFMNSTENYAIHVYDNDGVLVFDTDSEYGYLKDDINECGNTEWYKILVYPKNNNGLDETVDFGIVYFQKWSISYINLYINGEYDKIRWPESGINPKIISIRHINQPINSQKTK